MNSEDLFYIATIREKIISLQKAIADAEKAGLTVYLDGKGYPVGSHTGDFRLRPEDLKAYAARVYP